ncbi:MAG TPA: condensation domain-containing protein [Kutzneria sp.]
MQPLRKTGRELTLAQQALWFLQELAPDSSAYNVSGAVNLHFDVDVELLATAVRATVAAHDVLDCVFRPVGGEVRRLPGRTPFELDVHDLSLTDDEIREFAVGLVRRPFRLARERPVRIALLRRTNGPDILLLAAHHIVMDNVSQLLTFAEILTAYSALLNGTEPAPTTAADFDEFVDRQREYLESPRADAARKYWQGRLADVPKNDIPTDRPRPAVYRFAGSVVEFGLSARLMSDVELAASARNTTTFAFLFSVFQLLLHIYSGQTDLLVGYPATLRAGPRFRDSIGYFVNTLPLRARIDPDASFDTLLRDTADELLRGVLHRQFPFALMPRLVDVKREPNRAGLIEVMFVLMVEGSANPIAASLAPGTRIEHAGLELSEFYVPQQQGQFDLTMQVQHSGGQARAELKYNTSLFTEQTARSLADDFVDLLDAAANDALPARLRDVTDGRNSPEAEER